MQLKTVGESLSALNSIISITDELKNNTLTPRQALAELTFVSKGYSTEAIKMAIAQTKLDEKQIKTILSSKGLKGEILETTTAELAQITANNALTASTLGLGTALKGLWATMKTNPLLMIATVAPIAITAVSKLVDKLITTKKELEEALEKMAQKAEEAKSNIKSLSDEMKSQTKTINDIKDRYAELAQGVDTFNNKNKSLSNEDYEEFLDLTNQLSEVFPQLNMGIDDNGNAILNLNGNVGAITSSLESLLEVEQALAQQKITEELDSYIENTLPLLSEDTKNLSKQQSNFEKNKNILKDLIEILNQDDFNNSDYTIRTDKGDISHWYDIKRLLNDFGFYTNEIEEECDVVTNKWYYTWEFTPEQANAIKNWYGNYVNTTEQEIKNAENSIKKKNSEFSAMLSYWLTDQFSNYDNIADNKELQNAVSQVFSNIKWNEIDLDTNGNGEVTKEEIYKWISNNIITPINTAAPEVQEALVKLLSGENMTLGEMQGLYNTVAEAFKNTPIPINFFVGDVSNVRGQLRKLMGYNHNVGSEERNAQIDQFIDGLSIDESNLIMNNLDYVYDYAQEHNKQLYQVSENEFQMFIKNLQKISDENQLEIPTSLDIAEDLKSATDAFSKLGDAENGLYADILAGNTIDSSDIFALKDDFGDIEGGRALENFADTLLNFPGDTKKAQEALNDLVTAYIDESGILDDLCEENKDYIRQELEKINVANAEEVVEDRLNDSVKKNIKAFKEFSTVLSQHLDTLKNASPETDEFKNSLETVKSSFEDFLKANFGDEEFELSLSDNFIIQNLEDIEAAASGSEEALNRVRIAAAKDIAANVNLNVPPQAYEGTLNQINSWIDNANIDTLQVGTYLDDTPLIQGLNNLVDAGTITRDDMNAILASIGVTPEISHESVPITLPKGNGNTFSDILGIGASVAATVLQIPKIRYKVSSNGAKARYSAPSTSKSSGGGSGGGSSSDNDNEFSDQIDWIEVSLKRLEEELNRLDKKSSNVYSLWGKRNTALNEQIAKTREEIILQQKAYDGYMAKANSIGLSDTYVSKVQNGTIQIEDITDENLADKISEYQTWYEKAIECKDAIQELNITLGDLASQKFDNLQTEYDDVISIFESLGNLVDETINRTEEHGYFVAKDYYTQLINYENQKLNELQQQYSALTKSRDEALRSGAIEENSQEWQNMTKSILDVENAIEQSTTSLVEFNNEIRDLDWEIFDYIEERISQITQESDYLIDLMENSNLYNETGAFTSEGKAATALHGINYNTYMQQALDYAKELKDIEQEISKDSANKDLIERREELLKLQQDAITNAEAEKDAIKSLVEEGINIHLDALSSLIDKYKDAMNSAKDLYDYQKNISSQVKEISNLEKQILAYEGDDSEEARKIIQETKLSLEEARTELKETEWDKYISETEQLLDTLYDDYEEVLNARLDNIDALVSDMIDMINSNGSEIKNTIEAVADKVGYTITDSLSKALGDGSHVNLLISNFSTKFDTTATTLQSSIDAIKSYVYKMTDEGKNKVASETKTQTNPSSPNSSVSSNGTHNSSNAANAAPSSNSSSATSNSGDGIARVGDAVTFVNGKYHEDSWGNGKSGNQLLGGTVYITKIAPNSPYPYHISRTSKFGEANLGWVKLEQLKGYAKGSRRISQNQLAWTQENGNEMLYRSKDGALLTPLSNGDMVFTNEMTQKLWEMANGNIAMPTFNPPKINTNLEQENKTINNDNKITITLPNVKNYDEFKSELQNDNKFVGFVQEVTLGEALGHNSMKRKKY